MLKNKENKTDIGITIDKEGNYLLDLYKFKYNREYNRLEITSRQFDITFGVNTDSIINFLNKNSDVIFGDF